LHFLFPRLLNLANGVLERIVAHDEAEDPESTTLTCIAAPRLPSAREVEEQVATVEDQVAPRVRRK
jgi:hypothetical protein